MLLKYRPEDKPEKKDRLLKRAQAESEGKTSEGKKPIIVKYGLNHVTYLIEQVSSPSPSLSPSPSSFDNVENDFELCFTCSDAEQGSTRSYCPRCRPDRVGCVASGSLQKDGNPLLHCQGQIPSWIGTFFIFHIIDMVF